MPPRDPTAGNGGFQGDLQTRTSRRASASADLGFLQPKQHPHTTQSGPRGIGKAQRGRVMRDIRPDPHNLPEELLRVQARNEAAVDALSSGTLYHQQDPGVLSPLLPVSPGHPGSTAGSPGIGTGAGTGASTGTGSSTGIVGERSSKWKRRLRRLTSPKLGRENRQRVFRSSVFTPAMESVIDGQVRDDNKQKNSMVDHGNDAYV